MTAAVIFLAQYRENHPKPRAQEPTKQAPWDVVEAIDRATMDLHTSAMISLRLIKLARQGLGLPEL